MDLDQIYNHPTRLAYHQCCQEVKYFLKNRNHYRYKSGDLPDEIKVRYQRAINDYRKYLDSIDIKMPDPKHLFDNKDMTTWRYISYSIINDTLGDNFIYWIKNKHYIER